MNPRTPWLRLDILFFVVFILAILWWVSEPAPWVDSYVVESRDRIDTANTALEKYLAVVQSNLAEQSRSRLMVGILIVVAGFFVALRARWQFLHAARYTERVCPVCGGPIVRVRRSEWQRIMGKVFFLPTRKYQCRNPECRWTGLRYGRSGRTVRHSHRVETN